MKIDLHNLLTISLWEEEYSSVVIRERSLIIVNKEGSHRTLKFPAALKELMRKVNIENSPSKTQEKQALNETIPKLKEPRTCSNPRNLTIPRHLQEEPIVRQVKSGKRPERRLSTCSFPFSPIDNDLHKLNELISSLISQKSAIIEEKSPLISSLMPPANYKTDLDQNYTFIQAIESEKFLSSSLRMDHSTRPDPKELIGVSVHMSMNKKESPSLTYPNLPIEEPKRRCQFKLKSGFFCSKPPNLIK